MFFDGRKYIVRANLASDYNFLNNLMVAAKRSTALENSLAAGPTLNYTNNNVTNSLTVPDTEDVACYLHTQVTNYNRVTVADNLCQGSALQGFVYPLPSCTEFTAFTNNGFKRNHASSCDIGFVAGGAANSLCLAMGDIKASHNNIAVLANPSNVNNIRYSNFMLTDNKRGITLMNGYASPEQNVF